MRRARILQVLLTENNATECTCYIFKIIRSTDGVPRQPVTHRVSCLLKDFINE